MAAVVVCYLVAMVAAGFFLRKRIHVASDFLITGRKLGLSLTTATLAAVQLGAGVILGGAELGAESGVWPGMWYGVGCGGGLILAGILVAAKLRKQGGYVPLDFFGTRYQEKKAVRIWGWLSNIPSLLGIFVAQILAAGSIFSVFGFSFTQGVIISGVVIMLYSVLGGMWGVVVTDFIQLGIIVIGIPLVAIIAMIKLGDISTVGMSQVLATQFIPAGKFSQAVFIIIPFLLSISISYDAYMRYQSAKSVAVAKWGCILAGILVMFISFCAGIAGAVGRILFPGIDNASVFPQMVKASLPPLAAGIVVAALLAAAMSSANSLLISLSGCFSRDLYNKVFHPSAKLDELKHSKTISRTVVVCAVIVGIVIAFRAEGILYTIIIFNYPYMGSMLVPLLGGVLWKGGTTRGALAAMLVGGAIGVVSFMVGLPGKFYGLFNIDLSLFIAYMVSVIVFVSVSLLTQEDKNTA